VTTTWGEISGLTVERAMVLRECLDAVVKDDVRVSYRDLYGFLAEGCFQLGQARADNIDFDPADLGHRVVATIHRTLPPMHKSPAVIVTEDEHQLVLFLETLSRKLKELLRIWRDYSEKMMKSFGDKITTDVGATSILNRYSEKWDSDHARMSLQEMGHEVGGATLRGMSKAIMQQLEAYVELMDKVLRKTRTAQGAT